MKQTRRFAAIIMAVMMLVMSVSAFAAEEITLPIFKEPTKLTFMFRLNSKANATMTSYNEMRLTEVWREKMNVDIEYIHLPNATNQQFEQYNLMRVSEDYPDMIYWEHWMDSRTQGGPTQALEDEFIIPLNDLIEQYAPNLSALLDSDPELRKMITTDDGTIYGFPSLKYKQSMKAVDGFMIRKDWLDKLGLEVPTTIDELHDVLVAFRDNDPNGNGEKDEIPLTMHADRRDCLTYFWGIGNLGVKAWANVDGKAVYGYYSDAFREAITTLAQWYAEGLIDPEFFSNDIKQYQNVLATNTVGATFGSVSSNTAAANASLIKAGYEPFIGIALPEGDNFKSCNYLGDYVYSGAATSITSTNPYPIESVKFCDYAYSPEGMLMWQAGIEGESYNLVDGKPVLTDIIMKNPNGLTIDQALIQYCLGSVPGPFVFEPNIREQRMLFEQWQRDSLAAWNDDNYDYLFPSISLTVEESEEFSSIMSDVETYVAENYLLFINGTRPVSELDDYMAQLKAMGIEDAIAIYQDALDRYNAR